MRIAMFVRTTYKHVMRVNIFLAPCIRQAGTELGRKIGRVNITQAEVLEGEMNKPVSGSSSTVNPRDWLPVDIASDGVLQCESIMWSRGSKKLKNGVGSEIT
jgi:hypothetical protein